MTLGGEATLAPEGATAPADQALGRGDTVGRYLVLGVRGRGGMGVVYTAHDPELDRKIAVKVLRPPLGGSLAAADRKRLLREARALAQLSHPNVVTLHDVGELQGGVFIAMEYIEGRTLRQWREETRRSWREILEVFIAAGRGLSAAHRAGFVHRDFKPDNVMIEHSGGVRVLDFGLATPDSAVLTTHDARLGTPAYMAAEQHGARTADARADQFSFCVALYETLYGSRPFGGTTPEQVSAAILRGRVKPPPTGSGVPRWVGRVVLRGLGVDPRQRWPDMDALLEALERGKGRRRQSVVGLGLAAFVGLLAGAWLFMQGDSSDCPERIGDVDRVWNDERRSAVRSSLEAAGTTPSTVARVDEHLAAYAGSLQRSAAAACADERDPDTPASTVAMRWSCHQQHLARFSGAVDMLATSPEGARDARRIVGSLPALSRCEAAEQMSQFREAVSDPEVARLQMRVQEIDLLWNFGGDDSLTADAEEALREAKRLGSDTAVALAAITLSKILTSRGELGRAGEVLEEAVVAAARAHSPDLEARAWHERAFVELFLHRPWAALAASHAASAAALRSPDDPVKRSQILNTMGAAYLLAGDLDAAHHMLSEAEQELRGDPLDDASAAFNLGVVESLQGDYRAAEQRLRAALARSIEARGDQSERVAIRKTNLADTLLQQGKYGEAETLYLEAIETFMETSGPDFHELARSRLHLAELHLDLGGVEKALALADVARPTLRESVGVDHPYALEGEVTVARVELMRARPDQALRRLAPAYERLGAHLGWAHPSLAPAAVMLARTYRELDDLDQARTVLDESWERLDAEHPGHPNTVVLLAHRAELALERESVEEARELYGVAALRRASAQIHPVDDAYLQYLGAALELAVGGDPRIARQRVKHAKKVFASHPGHPAARLDETKAILAELSPLGSAASQAQ